MGLSHATCGISNLPILEGELARLVLLVQTVDPEETAAGYHAGHALWTPWSLPICGTHDGYGRLVPVDTWHPEFILKRLDEVLVEREEGDNPFVDRPVTKKKLGADKHLKELQDRISDNRVFIKADVDGEHVAAMGSMFIHEEVYRALVEAPAFTESTVMTAKDQIAREMNRMQNTNTNPLFTGEAAQAMEQLQGTSVGETIQTTLAQLQRYMRLTESVGSYGPPGIRGIGSYRLHIAEQVMGGMLKDHPYLIDEVEQFGSFIHFLAHFEFLRKLWQPQNGLGSQRTGWGSHVILSSVVHKIARAGFEAETEAYQDPPENPTP